ncbi:MAG: Trm112 family protein [Rhizobiaceae bacterium]|nr:Trm112 family protein [Rhizobiaceae bacterium]
MSDERTVSNALIDPRLLDLLSCPLTKGPLSWRPATSELVSKGARLAYPVRDGIPIMLPSEARALTDADDEVSVSRG